jgi:hypothetical protein
MAAHSGENLSFGSKVTQRILLYFCVAPKSRAVKEQDARDRRSLNVHTRRVSKALRT